MTENSKHIKKMTLQYYKDKEKLEIKKRLLYNRIHSYCINNIKTGIGYKLTRKSFLEDKNKVEGSKNVRKLIYNLEGLIELEKKNNKNIKKLTDRAENDLNLTFTETGVILINACSRTKRGLEIIEINMGLFDIIEKNSSPLLVILITSYFKDKEEYNKIIKYLDT